MMPSKMEVASNTGLTGLTVLTGTLKAKCRTDGLDGLDWLSYTAVPPRASLQSDAKK